MAEGHKLINPQNDQPIALPESSRDCEERRYDLNKVKINLIKVVKELARQLAYPDEEINIVVIRALFTELHICVQLLE
jgi:hypothetical protein